MAAKRYRHGLASYKPRTASTAFRKKRAPSSTSKAGRRAARTAAYRGGKLPKPGTAAAARRRGSFTPDTEEARFLVRAARDFELSGGRGRNEYLDELRQLQDRAYRAAYNAQHRGSTSTRSRRSGSGAKNPGQKKRKARVRVRAHWRGPPR